MFRKLRASLSTTGSTDSAAASAAISSTTIGAETAYKPPHGIQLLILITSKPSV